MILDILYFAKERDLQWETFDVSSFIIDITHIIQSKITTSGIDFTHKISSSVSTVEIDTSVVRTALVNILENAIDACTEDKTKDRKIITLSVNQDKNCIIFEITDNGIGMDKETQEKLFTLFHSSKGKKGTGFGLFIANNIIQQHGGTIKVTSNPNQGSQFLISIPHKIRNADI